MSKTIKSINLKLRSRRILKNLMYDTGLFAASSKNVSTGYNVAWIRDNIYQANGMETFDFEGAIKTYHALFEIFKKHVYKIDWASREKPDARYKYIHARYDPNTLEEFWDEWGNKQNDAVGAFLFKVGTLEKSGKKVLRDKNDLQILQKLVDYLRSVQYWHDEDNGVWEENEEVHASSVGACVAGLKAVQGIVDVDEELIQKGMETLNSLLPRESATKEVDMALLSLIYPYNIVTPEQRDAILQNVEKHLVRENGVIRYFDDYYYNEDGEAEWCMGFPWLAKIYKDIGNQEKYRHYISKTTSVMTNTGEIPELYFANSGKYNENTPLGWSQALYLAALA